MVYSTSYNGVGRVLPTESKVSVKWYVQGQESKFLSQSYLVPNKKFSCQQKTTFLLLERVVRILVVTWREWPEWSLNCVLGNSGVYWNHVNPDGPVFLLYGKQSTKTIKSIQNSFLETEAITFLGLLRQSNLKVSTFRLSLPNPLFPFSYFFLYSENSRNDVSLCVFIPLLISTYTHISPKKKGTV